MGELHVAHELTWRMKLCEGGYTCFELVPRLGGMRWGWIINASVSGWMAHTGAWADVKLPIPKEIGNFDTIADAKEWVEAQVAAGWEATVKEKVDG